jgi:2,4'-dihydroxyacetophenone dioxygenase
MDARNVSEPAAYSGAAPERARVRAAGQTEGGDPMSVFREILLDTGDLEWVDKTLAGLSHKMLWRDEEIGASIGLIRFRKGAGIPNPHSHASNQFMFCLEGRYRYLPTGLVLTPGSFYWNPKGAQHGPTEAEEDSVLLEVYDGPHYPTQPEWFTDEEDAR